MFSRQQCCQPRAARYPSRFSTHESLFISIVCRQSCASGTSDLAPNMYPSIAEQFSHLWHAPTRRRHWVFEQEMSTHTQLSLVRFHARLFVFVSLRLAPSQFALSFLSRWCAVLCETTCMAHFKSRVPFDDLAAFAPLSCGPLSLRGPRIVRRHVLLSRH